VTSNSALATVDARTSDVLPTVKRATGRVRSASATTPLTRATSVATAAPYSSGIGAVWKQYLRSCPAITAAYSTSPRRTVDAGVLGARAAALALGVAGAVTGASGTRSIATKRKKPLQSDRGHLDGPFPPLLEVVLHLGSRWLSALAHGGSPPSLMVVLLLRLVLLFLMIYSRTTDALLQTASSAVSLFSSNSLASDMQNATYRA